jgi:hypothetical protein
MSEQPAPTPAEEDAPLERRTEEDAERYPAHENPERVIDPGQQESGLSER